MLDSSDRPAHESDADALVLFSQPALAPGEHNSSPGGERVILCGADRLPPSAVEHLRRSLHLLRAKGAADEVILLTHVPEIGPQLVAVSGLGQDSGAPSAPRDTPSPLADVSPERFRRASGAAGRALAGRGTVAVLTPDVDADRFAGIGEGLALGAYEFSRHRGVANETDARKNASSPRRRLFRRGDTPSPDPLAPVRRFVLHVPSARRSAGLRPNEVAAILDRTRILERRQSWARDLVNTAPNELSPQAMADAVLQAAPSAVRVDVLDEAALAEARCAGLLAVGQGSSRPPRLVTLAYRPKRTAGHIALVGKGITFDSGGLSLKPPTSMITMKCDMAGAAAVAAAVFAIADLGLPLTVTGYLCLAENLPSATAQRPGDVLTMRNGRTVEVINTDAEGRLVLADALCLATETKPDAVVDVATLTGAAITALGKRTAAVLANDDDLQAEVTTAATLAGETVWPLPIAEEIRGDMASSVADLKHTGDTAGGTMVGAAFLREFVGAGPDGRTLPWAHLDIAGPAFNDGKPYGHVPKGGTGFAMRSLVVFAEGRAGRGS